MGVSAWKTKLPRTNTYIYVGVLCRRIISWAGISIPHRVRLGLGLPVSGPILYLFLAQPEPAATQPISLTHMGITHRLGCMQSNLGA